MNPYAKITKHKVLRGNLDSFSDDELFKIRCDILEFKNTHISNCVLEGEMLVSEYDYFYLVTFINKKQSNECFSVYLISEINISYLDFYNCPKDRVCPYHSLIEYCDDNLYIPVVELKYLDSSNDAFMNLPIYDTYMFDLSHLSLGNTFKGYTE